MIVVRVVISVAVAVALTGCAQLFQQARSPYPVMPHYNNSDLSTPIDTKIDPPFDLSSGNAHVALVNLERIYDDAARGRQANATVANELIYYGTLAAVLGVTLDSRAARNTGAAVAAGGDLFNSHYKTADQQAILKKAVARVRCGEDALRPLTVEIYNSFGGRDGFKDVQPSPTDDEKKAGVVDALTAVDRFPADTQNFLNGVQVALENALDGVALTTSSDDLSTTVSKYNDARKKTPPTKTPADNKVQKLQNDVATTTGKADATRMAIARQALTLHVSPEVAYVTDATAQHMKATLDAHVDTLAQQQDQLAAAQTEASQQRDFVVALYAYKPALDVCLKLPQ